MPNIDSLIQLLPQNLSANAEGDESFCTTIDLKYLYSQLNQHPETARHCNFKTLSGDMTGNYRFKSNFYGLTDMPAGFQKAFNTAPIGLPNT